MLKITVGSTEAFNDETQEFVVVGGFELLMEHSLVSLSKWESATQKPFLTKDGKTADEIKFYMQCMIVNEVYPADIVNRFTQKEIDLVTSYIESSQSATTFGEMPEVKGRGETITSELIYYWMVAFTIPFECETWHLNRLFSLIRICNIKNQPKKKMNRKDLAAKYRQLNAERRAKLGTKG